MGLSPDAIYSAVSSDVSDIAAHVCVGDSRLDSPKSFAAAYLLESVIRKWIPKDTREADKNAFESFASANNRCRDWKPPSGDAEFDDLFSEMSRIIHHFLHPQGDFLVQSYFDLLRSGRPGPGVGVGANGTSLYTKFFASPLTSTSEYLYEEYKNYTSWIPFLSEAECQRYEKFGPPRIVSGSKCSFVPKTSSTSRMICIEPTVNMFYQLGLASILEDRLKSFFGIDLSYQPELNMRMAQEGSFDGSFATIDLKSASDSISLRLCESLFPKWFFELLLTLRSHDSLINEARVPLYMISTMGNGFTFPLQTIIFSAALVAVQNLYGSESLTSRWAVFGDDIVCRTDLYDRLCHFLEQLNFVVNTTKSFKEGPFRESCGADYYFGNPVRPVFLRKLDTPQDITVAINQLNNWSAYTGISLCNTVALLVESLGKDFNPVPYESNLDAGVRVPLAFINPNFDKNGSYVYKTYERRPSLIRVFEGATVSPNRSKKLFYNPCGLYCSFLYGELRNYTIAIRHDRWLYKKRLRHSPYWDYVRPGQLTNGTVIRWQQWETAVCINLHKSSEKSEPRA